MRARLHRARALTVVTTLLVGAVGGAGVVGVATGSPAGAATPKCKEVDRLRPSEPMSVSNELPVKVAVKMRDYTCAGWRWPAGPTQLDGTVKADKYRVVRVEPIPTENRRELTDFTVVFSAGGSVIAEARVGWRQQGRTSRYAQLVGEPEVTPITVDGRAITPKVEVRYGLSYNDMILAIVPA